MPQNKSNPYIDLNENNSAHILLSWYDLHKRALPWRAMPDETPNPYYVWLSEVMLQQTTVNAVIPYFLKFVKTWPTVQHLANAQYEDVMSAWAGLGYYARARNLYKCAQTIVKDYNGLFPQDQKTLQSLPGIGDYTSAAIRSIAFDKPATVVDGNIERVMTRLYEVTDPLPHSKKQLKALASDFFVQEYSRPGDLAQALMDLGATICIPKVPRCALCPLIKICRAQQSGLAAALPYKIKKADKPKRFGHIYFVINEKNQILVERRPDKGLLGGTLGFPTSDWVEYKNEKPVVEHELLQYGVPLNLSIFHVFTHFELELSIYTVCKFTHIINKNQFWRDIDNLDAKEFPTVFKKPFIAFLNS